MIICNFVIRPIKSYATVDLVDETGSVQTVEIERGEYLDVKNITNSSVYGFVNGDEERQLKVSLDVFVHAFTANPDDIKKVREEEYKTMGYNPNKSKDSKESK